MTSPYLFNFFLSTTHRVLAHAYGCQTVVSMPSGVQYTLLDALLPFPGESITVVQV
jgi:hypothetical protein